MLKSIIDYSSTLLQNVALKHFEYELHCLNECLKGMDPFLNCELDTNSFDDPNLKLQTFKYNENVKDIFEATIGHQFKCTYSTHALIFECFN